MKRVLLIFLMMLAPQAGLFAQGVGTFPGNDEAEINFFAISNAPLSNLPSGAVFFSPLMFSPDAGYSTNVLVVDINVGSIPNTDGWIVQQESDGSLTPILQLAVGPHYTGLGSPPAWYSDYASTQLTEAQVQSFFAGQLYAQTYFEDDSYLGQLLPVPEPSGRFLISIGIGLLFSCGRLTRSSRS